MELACLAHGPEKGLELGKKCLGKAIQNEYIYYEIKNGLRPTVSTPIPTCPETTPGPQNVLVLKHTGKILFDNTHYELVPVVVDLAGTQLPDWCPSPLRKLYLHLTQRLLSRKTGTHAGEEMPRSKGRKRREILNDLATAYEQGHPLLMHWIWLICKINSGS